MKQILDDPQLEQVAGGTVVFSNVYNAVAFVTTQEKYNLTCDWKEARNYVEELLEQHPEMSDAAFDQFAKQQLVNKGWLGSKM